jgi:hypothetical protein
MGFDYNIVSGQSQRKKSHSLILRFAAARGCSHHSRWLSKRRYSDDDQKRNAIHEIEGSAKRRRAS